MTTRALIIDDEEALRDIISEVLNHLNIESFKARNGFEALEIVKRHSNEIDLVLIDLYMPHMNGHETFSNLKDIMPDRPVIFMSGYDDDQAMANISLNHNQKFLKKPFTISQLKEVVNELL